MAKEVVLSGIRPTGFLHLGNYFGAMRNYVRMQDEYNCYFFVANWHSLTTHPDTKELQTAVHRVIAENVACGLDPEKVSLYVQSDVPEIAELYLYLNMLAYKGELEKTTTFKDKVRNFAQRFNHRYGDVLPEPYAFNYGGELVKILSLDGNGKMSKSENQLNTLYLADEDDLLKKKIMKAKTDGGPETPNSSKPDYIENLFTLMKLVSAADTVQKFEDDFNASSAGNCIIRYGDMKKQLAEDMIKFITPIRERAADIQNNRELLSKIIKQGADKARESASATLHEVRKAIRMDY